MKKVIKLLKLLILFVIIQVIVLIYTVGLTYSSKNDKVISILTYKQGKLTWDINTKVDEKGVAELSLFEESSINSKSYGNIIFPGANESNVIKLRNTANNAVKYTVVVYNKKTNDEIPVVVELTGENLNNTEEYTLPQGVEKQDVIRAVYGTIDGNDIKDFEINWKWEFYENNQQDVIDTILGNNAIDNQITVGVYVVIEDNNQYISPKTGDNSIIEIYFIALIISIIILSILLTSFEIKGGEEDE